MSFGELFLRRVASARLQDAVDLGTVRADLLGVVADTLEPAQASIWIGRAGPAGTAQAGGHSFATRVSTS